MIPPPRRAKSCLEQSQQDRTLFDDLVGDGEQRRGHGETERLGSPNVVAGPAARRKRKQAFPRSSRAGFKPHRVLICYTGAR
jgi:hypothetical protein